MKTLKTLLALFTCIAIGYTTVTLAKPHSAQSEVQWPDYTKYEVFVSKSVPVPLSNIPGAKLTVLVKVYVDTKDLEKRTQMVAEFDMLGNDPMVRRLSKKNGDGRYPTVDVQMRVNKTWVSIQDMPEIEAVDPEKAVQEGRVSAVVLRGVTTDGKAIEVRLENKNLPPNPEGTEAK